MFGLSIFSTQKYLLRYLWVISPFFLIDAGNSFLKNVSISWRQDPETTKFFKNKVKFVDYPTKLVVLPYSESYLEETKYILVKFYQFSCNKE